MKKIALTAIICTLMIVLWHVSPLNTPTIIPLDEPGDETVGVCVE